MDDEFGSNILKGITGGRGCCWTKFNWREPSGRKEDFLLWVWLLWEGFAAASSSSYSTHTTDVAITSSGLSHTWMKWSNILEKRNWRPSFKPANMNELTELKLVTQNKLLVFFCKGNLKLQCRSFDYARAHYLQVLALCLSPAVELTYVLLSLTHLNACMCWRSFTSNPGVRVAIFFYLHNFFTAPAFQSLEKEKPEPSFKPRSELDGFIFFIDAGNFHSLCHNIFLVFHILGITKQQHPQLGQTVLQQFFWKSKLAKTHKSPKHPSSS